MSERKFWKYVEEAAAASAVDPESNISVDLRSHEEVKGYLNATTDLGDVLEEGGVIAAKPIVSTPIDVIAEEPCLESTLVDSSVDEVTTEPHPVSEGEATNQNLNENFANLAALGTTSLFTQPKIRNRSKTHKGNSTKRANIKAKRKSNVNRKKSKK